MARSSIFVHKSKRKQAPLPDWTLVVAAQAQFTLEHGLLHKVADVLRFDSKRGFQFADLCVFFLIFTAAQTKGGIRGFREHLKIKGYADRLAAMFLRDALQTSSSVSRALNAADRIPDLDQKVAWLLSHGADVHSLLGQPVARHRDAVGTGWMVFDFDPSIIALRQRALPEGDDLPAVRRTAKRLCGKGYPGRHRGETQMSTGILTHTDTGLFLQVTVHPGHTPFVGGMKTTAKAVADVVDSIDFPRQCSLLRFDGGGGYGTVIAEVLAQGLHYLTRRRELSVFKELGVAGLLKTAVWFDVADSGSGPRRQATELGWVQLNDGSGGTILSRAVVSRFFIIGETKEKHGAGLVIGDYQYEVFVTSLDCAAWPANDTVTLYYGRCGQENLFGRAINKFGLNEVFCYDPDGQRLATALTMWASNLMVTRAAAHAGDLSAPPPQLPRPQGQIAATRPPLLLPAPLAAEKPAQVVTPAARAIIDIVPESPESPAQSAVVFNPSAPPLYVTCQNNVIIPLHSIRQPRRRGNLAIYRAPAGVCTKCPVRNRCSTGKGEDFRKEFSLDVNDQAIADKATIFEQARKLAESGYANAPRITPPRAEKPAQIQKPVTWIKPVSAAAGPLIARGSSLTVQVLVDLWQAHLAKQIIEVYIFKSKSRQQYPVWIAADDNRRRHRRQTWTERGRYNELRGSVRVEISPTCAGSPECKNIRKAA